MNLQLLSLFICLLMEDKIFCFSDFSNCSSHNKKYKVESTGKDTQECLNRISPCATLSYILKEVTLECVEIEIQDAQSLSGKYSLLASGLAIIGKGINGSSVSISCKENSGIYFESSQQIHLEKLDFIACAVTYNSTEMDSYPFKVAGLYLHLGSNISIIGCSFKNGTGTGVIMSDVNGGIKVIGTKFIGNKYSPSFSNDFISGGGLIIYQLSSNTTVHYTIKDCLFDDNVVIPEYVNSEKYRFGGGLTLANRANSSSFLEVLNTNFSNNRGRGGGGLIVNHTSTDSSYVEVAVRDCYLKNNSAQYEGGGIYITDYSKSSTVTVIKIIDTHFINNTAAFGGGLGVYADGSGNITVIASGSHWIKNNAGTSSFGAGFSANFHGMQGQSSKKTPFFVTATLRDCIFLNNTNTGSSTNLVALGTIFIEGARVNIISSLIRGNRGTALYIRYSGYATFSGKINFEHNVGIHGAAIHLEHGSTMALQAGVHLHLHNNTAALERGGAIFIESFKNIHDFHTPCVFESLLELLQSSEYYSVTFSNNTVSGKPQSVYISDPTNCFGDFENNPKSLLLTSKKIFSYYPNSSSQIASDGYQINLFTTPNLTEQKILELMPGEHFYIHPNVSNVFGNPSNLRGNLVLVHDNQVSNNDNTEPIRLVGPSYISMDNYTRKNPLYIAGSVSTEQQIWRVVFLYRYGNEGYRDGSRGFQIKLVDCKAGFLYNKSSQICTCKSKDDFVCTSSSSACVRYGYWYGSKGTEVTVLPCPGQTCQYNGSTCPTSECISSPDFCQLDDNVNLCMTGRNGTLCSYCGANYSFTFGAHSCVNSSSCHPHNTVLIMFSVVVYWIGFILFVFLVLSFNLSVGSGFMYGIVYYYSVISLYTNTLITNRYHTFLLNICIALTQLSPYIIGNISLCFAESWTSKLNHTVFLYTTPIFIATAILSIIWLSRSCRFPRRISLAQNTPIHAISILILLSYCSLTFISFEILKPITIYHQTMVYIDPDLKYFDKEHLPYALLAIFIEFFITIPVCLLLLFAPCLSRKINLVKMKLKPIVDEFQACYRPECRWFAGYYFLARQLVYLANAIPQISEVKSLSPQKNIYLHYLNALILLVHAIFKPYRILWLNLLDTLLLMDILLISFIDIDTPSKTTFLYKAVPYTMALLPSLYLLGTLLILIGRRIQLLLKPCCSKQKSVWVNEKELCNNSYQSLPSQSQVAIDTTDGTAVHKRSAIGDPFYFDFGEREPLISDSSSICKNYDKDERNSTSTSSSVGLSNFARLPFSKKPFSNSAHPNSTNKASTN